LNALMKRLYEQLAARLLDYVEVTGLRVGGRLPSDPNP